MKYLESTPIHFGQPNITQEDWDAMFAQRCQEIVDGKQCEKAIGHLGECGPNYARVR